MQKQTSQKHTQWCNTHSFNNNITGKPELASASDSLPPSLLPVWN